MSHVDALSRYPVETVEVNQIDLTESDWILTAQLQDEHLKPFVTRTLLNMY